MLDIKKEIADFEHIEEAFFDIDKEKHIAYIKLNFEKPSDIFDVNYNSRIPILSDDFMDWIGSAFELIPQKYKIDLDVSFDDLQGWDEEALSDNFKKNVMLEYKAATQKQRRKNSVAYVLIGVGVALFIAMLLVTRLWQTTSVVKDIFCYISDIATTVTFWEAMCILIVERKENSLARKSMLLRFAAIKFHGTAIKNEE